MVEKPRNLIINFVECCDELWAAVAPRIHFQCRQRKIKKKESLQNQYGRHDGGGGITPDRF
jgi:hypothetical protein